MRARGGLAGPRWPVEDQARKLIGFDGAAQEPARPHDMPLPDKLVQGAWTHSVGQRRFGSGFGLATSLELGRGSSEGIEAKK